MDFEPMCPGFESRKSHDFFFFFYDFFIYLFIFVFFCRHYYYSANLQIQHYCFYSVSRSLLLASRTLILLNDELITCYLHLAC